MTKLVLNEQEYRNKVLGCWMGKNIGGTVGAPFEWKRQKNNVTFYVQQLDGNPLPNDDLDIQLLWLIALEEKGVRLDAKLLGEYWLLYVTPHWSEYGICKINMRAGLQPPLSGTANNPYKDSCGAYIRSEIWACIAPGHPELAAKYAFEDAIIDHGNGEGVHAEVFCAALESAAFVVNDVNALIDIGLSYIPQDSGVARAVRCAIDSYQTGKPWEEAREAILRDFRGRAMGVVSDYCGGISEEDKAKGYEDGPLGWDVPSNIAMLLIGLLYGEGDFERSVCLAVNCGEDTDCTAATVGAIIGIMQGIDAIPERWIAPIGRSIKTACLNMGELGYYGDTIPANIDVLTDRVVRVAHRVEQELGLPLALSTGEATDTSALDIASLLAKPELLERFRRVNGPVYQYDFFEVYVDYGEDPYISSHETKSVRIVIRNTYKLQANLHLRWHGNDALTVASPVRNLFSPLAFMPDMEAIFEVQAGELTSHQNRLVLEITQAGRPTVMHVPLLLLAR